MSLSSVFAYLPLSPLFLSCASRWQAKNSSAYFTFGGIVRICAYPSRRIRALKRVSLDSQT